MVNEFKVGDQVAHTTYGNGEIEFYNKHGSIVRFGTFIAKIPNSELRPRNFLSKIAEEQEDSKSTKEIQRFIAKDPAKILREGLKDIVGKTVDQQFNEEFAKDCFAYGTGVMKDGKHVPHSEVFRRPEVIGVDMASGPDVGFESIVTPQGLKEFITDAYGIKRDPVTLLEIESDGLVKINSIKDTVRSMG